VEDIKNGNSEDCFAAHLYQKREEYGLTENEAMFAGSSPPPIPHSFPTHIILFPLPKDSAFLSLPVAKFGNPI
jgi:hypothetical protein